MILSHKRIVITGCNRGIGRAILSVCAASGAEQIWACIRTLSEDAEKYFEDVAAQYGTIIKPVFVDFLDETKTKNAAKTILSDKVQIDGIVNNAGLVGDNRLFTMTPMRQIREVFEVNFFGPMALSQQLVKSMMRNRTGSIVNIASVAALDGEPAQFEYVASKAAVIGATKKLASELGKAGIRVNAVAPGITETEMLLNMNEDVKRNTLDRMILNRPAKPSEIANAVAFLLSDMSSFITGQTIRIDGGSL